MIYRSYTPPPPLSYFVEALWYYAGVTSAHRREKLLPDGAMELVIDLTEIPKKLHDSANPERFTTFRNCWISGMQQGFLIIGNEPDSSMIGARFRTGGAFPFFGFPMSELSSQVVELELIWKRDILALREQLLEQPATPAGNPPGSPEGKFAVLESFLIERARQRLAADDTVSFALRQIAASPAPSVRELAGRIGLSQKGLISRFNSRVGLTPKAISRVFRFQRVIQAVSRKTATRSVTLRAPEPLDWADLAVACGYYDQAHFNHEFRRFSGLSPTQYLCRTGGDYLNWVPAD